MRGVSTRGRTANSASEPAPDAGGLTLRLKRAGTGATVTKPLRRAADAAVLWQTHRIEVGRGALAVAHQPMVRLAGAGRPSLTPGRLALTPLEAGRHHLGNPAEARHPAAFPALDALCDLARLPRGADHEDFAVPLEAVGSALGWSAVLHASEDDVVFMPKGTAALPATMPWWSDGGRDHAPWIRRHRDMRGVDNTGTVGDGGLVRATGPNLVTATGMPTTLALGGVHRIAHAIGALSRSPGWTRVADIALHGATLRLTGNDGAPLDLPLDPGPSLESHARPEFSYENSSLSG